MLERPGRLKVDVRDRYQRKLDELAAWMTGIAGEGAIDEGGSAARKASADAPGASCR